MRYEHHKTSHTNYSLYSSGLFNRAMVEIPKDLCTSTHVASVGSTIPNHEGLQVVRHKVPSDLITRVLMSSTQLILPLIFLVNLLLLIFFFFLFFYLFIFFSFSFSFRRVYLLLSSPKLKIYRPKLKGAQFNPRIHGISSKSYLKNICELQFPTQAISKY